MDGKSYLVSFRDTPTWRAAMRVAIKQAKAQGWGTRVKDREGRVGKQSWLHPVIAQMVSVGGGGVPQQPPSGGVEGTALRSRLALCR